MSNQAPEALDWGAGWIQNTAGYGYAVVDHDQEAFAVLPATSQRALQLEEARGRREQAEAAAAFADRVANYQFAKQRAGHSFRSGSEVLAGFRWPKATPCACGHVEVCRCPGETLADREKAKAGLSRRALRNRQLEREAALSPEQRELREIRGELTHLRAMLHAKGVVPVAGQGAGFRGA
jgi:hypothetical protein